MQEGENKVYIAKNNNYELSDFYSSVQKLIIENLRFDDELEIKQFSDDDASYNNSSFGSWVYAASQFPEYISFDCFDYKSYINFLKSSDVINESNNQIIISELAKSSNEEIQNLFKNFMNYNIFQINDKIYEDSESIWKYFRFLFADKDSNRSFFINFSGQLSENKEFMNQQIEIFEYNLNQTINIISSFISKNIQIKTINLPEESIKDKKTFKIVTQVEGCLKINSIKLHSNEYNLVYDPSSNIHNQNYIESKLQFSKKEYISNTYNEFVYLLIDCEDKNELSLISHLERSKSNSNYEIIKNENIYKSDHQSKIILKNFNIEFFDKNSNLDFSNSIIQNYHNEFMISPSQELIAEIDFDLMIVFTYDSKMKKINFKLKEMNEHHSDFNLDDFDWIIQNYYNLDESNK